MYLVNGAMLTLGIVLTVVSGLILTHHADLLNNIPASDKANDVASAVFRAGPIIAAFTGSALIILGLLGCLAASNYGKGWAKCLLCLYSLLSLSVFVLALVAGALELHLSGQLARYSSAGSGDVHTFDQDVYKAMTRFANDTFHACCHDGNRTTGSGSGSGGDSKGCELLDDVFTAHPDACDNEADFQSAFFSFLSKKLKPLGVVSIVTGVVSFFVVVASCCLLWRSKKDDKADAAARQRLIDAEAGRAGPGYAPPAAGQRGQVRYT